MTPDTKWEKPQNERLPLSEQEIDSMCFYYSAGLRIGKTSNELLEELGVRFRRSTRQIQRYLSDHGGIVRLHFAKLYVETRKENSTDHFANFATALITAEGGKAIGCSAKIFVGEKGDSYPLHWVGTEYTSEESSSPKIDIDSDLTARLDIAFALPPKTELAPDGAVPCGEVPLAVRWDSNEASGVGCFIAQPLALNSPNPALSAYLPPAIYPLKIEVTTSDGQNAFVEAKLTSPVSWNGLAIEIWPSPTEDSI